MDSSCYLAEWSQGTPALCGEPAEGQSHRVLRDGRERLQDGRSRSFQKGSTNVTLC